jgi:8-oxo-dGTP diphosphatase
MSERVPIPVVAALLEDADGYILIGRRPPTKPLPMRWEFPGGKVEEGETPLEALARELKEELSIRVIPVKTWPVYLHHYEKVTVEMHAFTCRLAPGSPAPYAHEHMGLVWARPEQLEEYDLCPADLPLIPLLQEAARTRP